MVDGLNAGADVDGLHIEADGSTIKGLVIRRFKDYGVQISGVGATGNRIEGNYIGTRVDGTGDLGNDQDGVHITGRPDLTAVGRHPQERPTASPTTALTGSQSPLATCRATTSSRRTMSSSAS